MKIELANNKLICFDEDISATNIIAASEIEKKTLFALKNKVKKEKNFILFLDVAQVSDLNLVLKKYYHLYRHSVKSNLLLDYKNGEAICLAYVQNATEDDLEKIKDFFFALSIDDDKERYNYIYDEMCDELDNIFRTKNLCDFKNDSCVAQRLKKAKNETMGCCYSFYYDKNGFPVNTGLCEHLASDGCKIKSLKCKMFTCKYLRKKGIKFAIKDFILLNLFLNKKQKKYLETAFFKTQEEIVNKWMEYYSE